MSSQGVCQACGAEHAHEREALEKLARLQKRYSKARQDNKELRKQLETCVERVRELEAQLEALRDEAKTRRTAPLPIRRWDGMRRLS